MNARPASGSSPGPGRPHAHDYDHDHPHDGDCDHATKRAAVAADALAQAEAVCAERSVRLTPIRRDVLSALYATHRPLGAYDIADIMAREAERRVAPITIYRALEFLLEQGFVHKLETRNAFIACPHVHEPGELVAFLICEVCGGVDEVSSPAFSGSLARVLAQAGFAPRARVVEIAGICAHCGGKAENRDDSVAEHA
ncbi:transcriptional repressor [Pseudochelatococcus sp. B33]